MKLEVSHAPDETKLAQPGVNPPAEICFEQIADIITTGRLRWWCTGVVAEEQGSGGDG